MKEKIKKRLFKLRIFSQDISFALIIVMIATGIAITLIKESIERLIAKK